MRVLFHLLLLAYVSWFGIGTAILYPEPKQIGSLDEVLVDCDRSTCPQACYDAGCDGVTSGGALDFCLADLTSDCPVLVSVTRYNVPVSTVCVMAQKGGWAFNLPYSTTVIQAAILIVEIEAGYFDPACMNTTAATLQYGYIDPGEWASCAVSSTALIDVPLQMGSPNVAFPIENGGQNMNRYVQVRSSCAETSSTQDSINVKYLFETGLIPGQMDPTTTSMITTTTTTTTTTTSVAETSTTETTQTEKAGANVNNDDVLAFIEQPCLLLLILPFVLHAT